MLKNFK